MTRRAPWWVWAVLLPCAGYLVVLSISLGRTIAALGPEPAERPTTARDLLARFDVAPS